MKQSGTNRVWLAIISLPLIFLNFITDLFLLFSLKENVKNISNSIEHYNILSLHVFVLGIMDVKKNLNNMNGKISIIASLVVLCYLKITVAGNH